MVDIAFSENDVKNFKALLDYFKQLANDGVNPLIEKQLLLMLDQSIPFFAHLHSQTILPELVRITIGGTPTRATENYDYYTSLRRYAYLAVKV
jgi:hypothetical protein